jgi:UTP--glucose-1-phosphate uridylyltransferase
LALGRGEKSRSHLPASLSTIRDERGWLRNEKRKYANRILGTGTMTVKTKKVRKAVLPVAGLGTRFLPATKAIPKEMLPIVDKPLIQYAVEECMASGIEHVIFVTGRRKSAIEDHFDRAPELEQFLDERGKSELAKLVRDISGDLQVSYTRQSEALGLGHAVLCAADLVGDEPFAVLLGDVIMHGSVPATRELVDIYEETGAGAIHVERVPRERVHLYGIVDAAVEKGSRWGDRLLRTKNLVEKPSAEKAPSNFGVTGRYVLPASIFDYLRNTKPGTGGEIQLTDGLCRLAEANQLFSCVYEGRTYDAGDKLGFLIATVELGVKDPKLGKDFRAYLQGLKP